MSALAACAAVAVPASRRRRPRLCVRGRGRQRGPHPLARRLRPLRRIFGGLERIAALQRLLRSLRERGCALRVLSFGIEGEIVAALRHIDVDACFDGVYSPLPRLHRAGLWLA